MSYPNSKKKRKTKRVKSKRAKKLKKRRSQKGGYFLKKGQKMTSV